MWEDLGWKSGFSKVCSMGLWVGVVSDIGICEDAIVVIRDKEIWYYGTDGGG